MSGTISGFAYHYDVIDSITNRPWFKFTKGKNLFHPKILEKAPKNKLNSPEKLDLWINKQKSIGNVKMFGVYLKAKLNYGIPETWLRNTDEDWDLFFSWIKGSSLPLRDEIASRKLG